MVSSWRCCGCRRRKSALKFSTALHWETFAFGSWQEHPLRAVATIRGTGAPPAPVPAHQPGVPCCIRVCLSFKGEVALPPPNPKPQNIHRINESAKIPLDTASDKVYYVNYKIRIKSGTVEPLWIRHWGGCSRQCATASLYCSMSGVLTASRRRLSCPQARIE
jgi:hypothetical protein